MTHPTTPDQGDERRAFEALWELYARVGDAHENHGRNHELTVEARATFHAALKRALSAAHPVAQEAITWSPAGYNKELAVDTTGKVRGEVCEHSIDPRWDARANDTRLGEYLNRNQAKAAVLAALAAPHPPVSAEAGNGVLWTISFTDERDFCLVASPLIGAAYTSGKDAVHRLNTSPGGTRLFGRMRASCLPSESVAVSGEVSDVAIDSAISTVWEDWEDDIDRRRELARAVLALAGSGGKV